ncbi:hypothetical protein LEP1GSC195_1389 [Leptospira wolbachii serovar Codice str. CDC]|uniref:Lipoprotein n=1 Tax=Leptospira wolbachii serovar Codice str. CDC TaxID=1218599 RepID=R8ZYI8_9LEPT|nr:hypothetical protein [Leptospira wolbachii]EOQ94784.1 hypothetical protein LEP1GSC195_1389 [Leptospira wolbachii serovar Codice str. CDC]
MINNNITTCFIFLILLNCLEHKSSLIDQKYKNSEINQIKKKIYIRNIEIISESGDLKTFQEQTIKSNIKNLLENSQEFESVAYYSDFPLANNSSIIDLKFLEYENKLQVDPYYFPLSLATLTLYIWFGGDIGNFDSKIKLELTTFNSQKKILAKKVFSDENIINDDIYDIWKSRREIPQLKSKFILNSIKEVLAQ